MIPAMVQRLRFSINVQHSLKFTQISVNIAYYGRKKALHHCVNYCTTVFFQVTLFGAQFHTGQNSRDLQSPLTFLTPSPQSSFDLGLEPQIVKKTPSNKSMPFPQIKEYNSCNVRILEALLLSNTSHTYSIGKISSKRRFGFFEGFGPCLRISHPTQI